MRGRRRVSTWLVVSALALAGAPMIGTAPAAAAGTVFFVDPVLDAVHGKGWSPGADARVLLGEKKPATVGEVEVGPAGDFAVDLTDDVRPGAVVTVTDGATSLVHTVTTLKVRSVDTATDTVTGAAPRDSTVEVGILGADVVTEVVADRTGRWSTSGLGDLSVGIRGYAAQYGPDRSAATWVGWETHNPVFRVEPSAGGYAVWSAAVGDRLGTGYEWPANTTLTAILDPVGAGPLETLDLVTDKYGEFASFSGARLGTASAAGDLVTVTDGIVEGGVLQPGTDTVTKSLVVSALTLEPKVDTVGDVVRGTAAPGSTVYVQPTLDVELATTGRYVTARQDGTWVADFSVPSPDGDPAYDVVVMSMGYAAQQDEDGDATHIGYHAWVPNITVYPDSDRVEGRWWGDAETPEAPPHTTMTVTIAGDPGSPYEVLADGPEDSFSLELGYDLRPGDVVTATDGYLTKEHVVQTLTMSVDEDNDLLTGQAFDASGAPADGVWTAVWDDSTEVAPWRSASVLSTPTKVRGSWTADYGTVADGYSGSEEVYDITPASSAEAMIGDEDADNTAVRRDGESPPLPPSARFSVDPNMDAVWGADWTPNGSVEVTVDGSVVGTAPLDTDGGFWLDLSETTDLVAGDAVTVSDGTTAKGHVVSVLTVTGVDVATDRVTGVADPALTLTVGVWDDEGQSAAEAAPSPTAAWTASFEGLYDVVSGTVGYAGQTDEDGDETWIDWAAP